MKRLNISASAAIYIVGFLFNIIIALIAILIPLYGLIMGYSAMEIGLLLSIPGIAQFALRLFAGVYSDYFYYHGV